MTGISRRSFAQAISLAVAGGLPLWAQADLDKVRAGGVLKVAVYKDFAPFSHGSDNAIQGIEVALAQALATEMGLKLSLLPFDAGENMADDLRNMVWRGHYLGYGPAHVMLHVPVDRNFIIGNKQSLIFAPYYRETLVFVHDKKQLPDLQKVDDLKGVQIGVERGTAAASAVLGALQGQLRDKVSILNSPAEAMAALFAGKVATVLATKAQIESELHQAQKAVADYPITALQLNGLPPNGWPVGMAVKADATDLAKAIEAALASLNTKGDLKKIFEQSGVSLGKL